MAGLQRSRLCSITAAAPAAAPAPARTAATPPQRARSTPAHYTTRMPRARTCTCTRPRRASDARPPLRARRPGAPPAPQCPARAARGAREEPDVAQRLMQGQCDECGSTVQACQARRRALGSAWRGGYGGRRERKPAPQAGACATPEMSLHGWGPGCCVHMSAPCGSAWEGKSILSVFCRCTAQPASSRLSIAREGLQQQLGALFVALALERRRPEQAGRQRASRRGPSRHHGRAWPTRRQHM